MHERTIRSSYFQNDVGDLFNCVQIVAANIVSFARAEVVSDICDRAHGIGEIS